MELASFLSPYGPEPPSEELLGHMLYLPKRDRAELAEIMGGMALEMEKTGAGAPEEALAVRRMTASFSRLQPSRCAVCG